MARRGVARVALCGNSVQSAVSGWYLCMCGCGRVTLCRGCEQYAPVHAAHRPWQQHGQGRVAGGVGVSLHAQQPVTIEVVADVCARLGMEVH